MDKEITKVFHSLKELQEEQVVQLQIVKMKILDKNIKDEDIDWLYGGKEFIVTKEEIEALLNGQKLYGTINEEYAFTIELERGN